MTTAITLAITHNSLHRQFLYLQVLAHHCFLYKVYTNIATRQVPYVALRRQCLEKVKH